MELCLGSNLSSDNAVTDLPEPLSPTRARSSPFFNSRERLLTATVRSFPFPKAIPRFPMESTKGNGLLNKLDYKICFCCLHGSSMQPVLKLQMPNCKSVVHQLFQGIDPYFDVRINEFGGDALITCLGLHPFGYHRLVAYEQ